jgi:hypothetical protein
MLNYVDIEFFRRGRRGTLVPLKEKKLKKKVNEM